MSDAQTLALQVQQARELFFSQGAAPAGWVAPHISRSWQRSRPLALQPQEAVPMALGQLQERREQAMRLLDCAQPELDGLAEHAVGNGCVVILSDASGLILDEIGSPDFLPKAQRIALMPGVEWSESHRGTNAIGTALAEREALMVLGGEHYLAQNGALGCAAAPILTGRGELAGALDISGEAVRVNPHALGLVRMAAQQVEHRMLLAAAEGQVLRFHRRSALIGTPREGLLVVSGGRIVAANRVALALFGSSWPQLLDQDAEAWLGRGWGRLEQQCGLLTLPGGPQIAALVERVREAPGARRAPLARVGPGADTIEVVAMPVATPPLAPPQDDVAPLLQRAVRVLNEGVPVLINGETGSGKEVFARRLHAAGRRAGGPFVAVDCASLPENLIEAELFGYEEGAFTGARRRGQPGRIRAAQGGLLFLDEIAEMPVNLQTRLLRVLEERVVQPLGGGPAVKVDFDLVCATHGDLQQLSAQGLFRSDLMYRLAGFTARLPALRERHDRRALIERLFTEASGERQLVLSPTALDRLAAWPWPGNVRELRSVLRALVALADPGVPVRVGQLPPAMQAAPAALASPPEAAPVPDMAGAGGGRSSAEPLVAITRHAIDKALQDNGHDVALAAQQLGIHRSTVYRHLARLRPRPV